MSLLKRRIYAFVIDLYAIFFLANIAMYVFTSFLQQIFPSCPNCLTRQLRHSNSISFTFALNFIFFCYFFLCYYLTNGASLGKMLMKIRIYSTQAPTLSLGQAFWRAFSQGLYYLALFLPFALQFLNPRSRSLGDTLAATFIDFDHGPERWRPIAPPLALPLLNVYPETIQLPYSAPTTQNESMVILHRSA